MLVFFTHTLRIVGRAVHAIFRVGGEQRPSHGIPDVHCTSAFAGGTLDPPELVTWKPEMAHHAKRRDRTCAKEYLGSVPLLRKSWS